MFHTAGYFRGVSCPFFEHGLCHRPHCHFKHAKPKSTTQRKPPKLNVKHSKFINRSTPVHDKSEPSSATSSDKDKESIVLSSVTKSANPGSTHKGVKHDSAVSGKPAGGGVEGGKKEENESESRVGGLTTADVGIAVGHLSNFFGSIETTDDDVMMVVSAPEATSEEITVTDSVPSYAPEKCETEYPGKGSSQELGKGSSDTDLLTVNVEPPGGVTELETMLVTEHDIFGSPDEEEVWQEGEGDPDVGNDETNSDMPAPTAVHEETLSGLQEDVLPSAEDLERMEAEFKRITSQGAGKDESHPFSERKRKALEVESTIVDPAAKKRRLAHSNVQMVREPARVTPRAPVIKSNFSSTLDQSVLYVGKKRIATTNTSTTTSTAATPSLKRPQLPLTTNAKIPTSIRQKFLNAFIDEHIKMTTTPKEAYDEALEEERALFERSNRRMIYMNLCTLALKKLREKVDQFLLEERKRSDARVEALLLSEGTSPEGVQKTANRRVSHDKDGHRKKIKKMKKKSVSMSVSVGDSSPVGERKKTSDDGAKSWKSLEAELQATFSSKQLPSSRTMISKQPVTLSSNKKDGDSQHVRKEVQVIKDDHKMKEKTNTHDISTGAAVSLPDSTETSVSHNTSSFKNSAQFYSKKKKKLNTQKVILKSGRTTMTNDSSEGVKGSLKRPVQHLTGTPQSSVTTVEGQRSTDAVEDLTMELFGDSSSSSSPEAELSDDHSSMSDDNDGDHSGMSFASALASGDTTRQPPVAGGTMKKILRPKMRQPSRSLVKGRGTGCVVKVKRKGDNKGQSSLTESKTVVKRKVKRSTNKTVTTPTTESTSKEPQWVQSSSDDLIVAEQDVRGQSSPTEDPLRSPLLELGKVPVLKLVRIQSPPLSAEQNPDKPVLPEKPVSLQISSRQTGSVSTDPGSEDGESSSLLSPSTPLPTSPLTPSFLPSGPFINLTRVAASQQKKNKMAATMSSETRAQLNKMKELKRKKAKSRPAATTSGAGVASSSSARAKVTVCVPKKKKEIELTPAVFLEKLKTYLLTEDQLVENGYPRPTEEVGVASINRGGAAPPIIEPLGSNAVRHRCCRCNKPFIIYNHGQYQTVEECVHHYGRLVKMKEYGEGIVSKYTCCQERRDSSGCQVAKLHVTAGDKPTRESGYVMTTPSPESAVDRDLATVFALDCEMCYTTVGLELTRVSVIDVNMAVSYETIVRPAHPIVDYNTRFSGLTADDFIDVTTTLSDVQDRLLQLFHEDTILLGHSLESDLRSLKVIHSCVVDTAIVFPHHKGPPFKRALKTLMAEYLMKFIQDNVDGGHDSLEDSRSCMELMMWKVKGDLKKETRRVPGV